MEHTTTIVFAMAENVLALIVSKKSIDKLKQRVPEWMYSVGFI
jgi:hypothetical protein